MTGIATSLLQRAARLRIWPWPKWVETVLLAALAFQCAGLFWALVTPAGAIGAWEPRIRRASLPAISVLRDTDPFRREGAPQGPILVTSLNLVLHGVRQNQGTGGGSAIIATPDGQQHSFAVGDDIVEGVKLTAVGFDNVTLSRAGIAEQLFMDQSAPAKIVGGPAGAASAAPPQPQMGAQ